ncbi:hypothetical protein I3843_10G026800 [Carya illinoinensis]|uniref:Reverse transcriptase zinc-binding domain-containing protein n=1 Tax=Carya illinoinensis TaxID=32201 RepID=A0A922DUQ5_CARIL|nr:hypothetical protein I3760_10G027300 [Carya illinoinensis]KAG6690701.1 hypothetical protein I3842_10G026900 [Carya illinoinensis]KAG7958569.1 hypothetical protein I3843_10G026800 [Carya illinoinensis]
MSTPYNHNFPHAASELLYKSINSILLHEWTLQYLHMCKKDGESVNHLFLHCEVVTKTWNEIFVRVGIAWVMPMHVVDFLTFWQGIGGSRISAAVWRMIPLCLFWCLWLERNGRCFEDCECSMGELREFFHSSLSFWVKNLVRDGNFCNGLFLF